MLIPSYCCLSLTPAPDLELRLSFCLNRDSLAKPYIDLSIRIILACSLRDSTAGIMRRCTTGSPTVSKPWTGVRAFTPCRPGHATRHTDNTDASRMTSLLSRSSSSDPATGTVAVPFIDGLRFPSTCASHDYVGFGEPVIRQGPRRYSKPSGYFRQGQEPFTHRHAQPSDPGTRRPRPSRP